MRISHLFWWPCSFASPKHACLLLPGSGVRRTRTHFAESEVECHRSPCSTYPEHASRSSLHVAPPPGANPKVPWSLVPCVFFVRSPPHSMRIPGRSLLMNSPTRLLDAHALRSKLLHFPPTAISKPSASMHIDAPKSASLEGCARLRGS